MRKHFLLFVFLTICSVCSFPQSAPVTGKISDASGQPVSFASVRIKGTRQGVSADAEGNFSIRVKTGDVLIISAFGVTTREIAITGEGPLTVQVTRNEGNLAEVVVTTALGIKREKRQLTYSAQEIKGDALVAAKQDNIINDLAGKVPGVQVTNSTGMPGSSARIVIRGNTSLTGNNQ